MIPDAGDSGEGHSDQEPNLQTGLFLQQFTNSVSRALYKERCAFKGYHLQSSKSTERLDYANCLLPSIHTLNNIQQQLITDDNVRLGLNKSPRLWRGDSTPTLKTTGYADYHRGQFQKYANLSNATTASQTSFNGHFNSPSRPKLKTPRGLLQISKNTKKGSYTDLELPKIMNIRDVKGNTWEIQEDASNAASPSPKANTILPNVHNTDHIHRVKVQPSESKRVSFNPVNMPGKNSKFEDVIFVETDRTGASNTTNTADSLEPACGVPPTNATRFHCMSDSDLHYHDEFERNKILQRLNSEARVRKITYNEYIQRLSQVQYCSCQREKMMNPENTGQESDVDWAWEDNREIYTRQGVPLFPPELKELYTRSHLTVSTMDINGVVDKRGDLQQQQEDENMSTEVSSFSPYSKRSKSRLRGMYKCSIQLNDQPNASKFCLKGTGVDRTNSKESNQRTPPNHRYSSRNPKGSEIDVSKRSLKPFSERDSSNIHSSKPTLKCSDGRDKVPYKLKRNQFDRERFNKISTVSKTPFVKIQAINPVFGKIEIYEDMDSKDRGYLEHQKKPKKTEHAEGDSQMSHFILESVSEIGFGAQRPKIASLGCRCNGHHDQHGRVAVTNVVFTSPVATM